MQQLPPGACRRVGVQLYLSALFDQGGGGRGNGGVHKSRAQAASHIFWLPQLHHIGVAIKVQPPWMAALGQLAQPLWPKHLRAAAAASACLQFQAGRASGRTASVLRSLAHSVQVP